MYNVRRSNNIVVTSSKQSWMNVASLKAWLCTKVDNKVWIGCNVCDSRANSRLILRSACTCRLLNFDSVFSRTLCGATKKSLPGHKKLRVTLFFSKNRCYPLKFLEFSCDHFYCWMTKIGAILCFSEMYVRTYVSSTRSCGIFLRRCLPDKLNGQ